MVHAKTIAEQQTKILFRFINNDEKFDDLPSQKARIFMQKRIF
jgi:hypothetical protein